MTPAACPPAIAPTLSGTTLESFAHYYLLRTRGVPDESGTPTPYTVEKIARLCRVTPRRVRAGIKYIQDRKDAARA